MTPQPAAVMSTPARTPTVRVCRTCGVDSDDVPVCQLGQGNGGARGMCSWTTRNGNSIWSLQLEDGRENEDIDRNRELGVRMRMVVG
jgi:hypothetical protein